MCTGSRPSTSSTRTSRICRASAPRVCSSSNTVGSVRTGMPRARHSRTIARARRARRGGDRDDHFVGLGLVEDARRGRLRCCPAPARRRCAGRACAGRRRGSRPAASPSSRLRMISRTHQPPAVAGAGDQDACARPCARRGRPPAAGARTRCARARARRPGTRARAARTARSRRWAGPTGDGAVLRSAGSGAPGAAPRSPRPSAARSRRPPARPPRSRAGRRSASGAGRRARAPAPAGSRPAPTRSCRSRRCA